MILSETLKGKMYTIVKIADESFKLQFIRMGFCEGVQIECYEKIPRGPIILKYHNQQIAIGRELANKIIVA